MANPQKPHPSHRDLERCKVKGHCAHGYWGCFPRPGDPLPDDQANRLLMHQVGQEAKALHDIW